MRMVVKRLPCTMSAFQRAYRAYRAYRASATNGQIFVNDHLKDRHVTTY
jgi:predicted NAD/FAD-binding protein